MLRAMSRSHRAARAAVLFACGDSTWLRVLFTRRISENGTLVRERVWRDSARREFH